MKTANARTFFAAALSLSCLACNNEPHSCSLDPNDADPAIATCAASDSSSCVVETHPACGGETCIKWRGEPGFCTVSCQDDAACGDNERCVEVVLASAEGHCVPAALVE